MLKIENLSDFAISNSNKREDYDVLIKKKKGDNFIAYCPQLNKLIRGNDFEEVYYLMDMSILEHIKSIYPDFEYEQISLSDSIGMRDINAIVSDASSTSTSTLSPQFTAVIEALNTDYADEFDENMEHIQHEENVSTPNSEEASSLLDTDISETDIPNEAEVDVEVIDDISTVDEDVIIPSEVIETNDVTNELPTVEENAIQTEAEVDVEVIDDVSTVDEEATIQSEVVETNDVTNELPTVEENAIQTEAEVNVVDEVAIPTVDDNAIQAEAGEAESDEKEENPINEGANPRKYVRIKLEDFGIVTQI